MTIYIVTDDSNGSAQLPHHRPIVSRHRSEDAARRAIAREIKAVQRRYGRASYVQRSVWIRDGAYLLGVEQGDE